MKILIDIKSGLKRISILADDTKNKLTVNGKSVDFDVSEFMFRFCDISMNWPTHLERKNMIDGSTISIVCKEETQTKEMKFVNSFPENFDKFNTLLNEVFNVERNVSRNH